jgi:hypothetical protein
MLDVIELTVDKGYAVRWVGRAEMELDAYNLNV